MVPKSGRQPPRAEGAAGIRVPPGGEREPAQLSDRQSTTRFKVEDQNIGSLLCLKAIQECPDLSIVSLLLGDYGKML